MKKISFFIDFFRFLLFRYLLLINLFDFIFIFHHLIFSIFLKFIIYYLWRDPKKETIEAKDYRLQ